MEHLPERIPVYLARLHRDGRLDEHKTEFPQVPEEDANHAERQADIGGDVDHRGRNLRDLQHRKMLGAKAAWVGNPSVGRGHRGD